MPETREEALGKVAWSSIPVGLSVGVFFGGNYLATGSLLVAAETTGFFVGLGAISAGLALAAAPALVLAAIAVAVGDQKTIAEVSTATEQLAPLVSPGVLSLVPIGAFVTPNDPTLFAKAFGPGVDLITGAVSPAKLDNLQAAVQGLVGFSAWRSDATNLGSYYSQNQSAASPGAPQGSAGGTHPSSQSTSPEGGGDHWSSGGYPYDFSLPGDGDSSPSSPSPDSGGSNGGGSDGGGSDGGGSWGIGPDGRIYIEVGPPHYYDDGTGPATGSPGTGVATPPETSDNNPPEDNGDENSGASNQGNSGTSSGDSSGGADNSGSTVDGGDKEGPDD
jgi:hypothetical protein